MSDMDKLAELRALAEKATGGEWRFPGTRIGGDASIIVGERLLASVHPRRFRAPFTEDNAERDANAAFIAAANPQTILALLDERDRLRTALEPFAAMANAYDYPDNEWGTITPHDDRDLLQITLGSLRRARAAPAPRSMAPNDARRLVLLAGRWRLPSIGQPFDRAHQPPRRERCQASCGNHSLAIWIKPSPPARVGREHRAKNQGSRQPTKEASPRFRRDEHQRQHCASHRSDELIKEGDGELGAHSEFCHHLG